MTSTRRSAYTLFELMLVLALIVLLSALSIPTFTVLLAEYRMDAASDAIQSGWETARSRAMNEGRPYRFAIVPNKGNYRIAPDSPEFWADGSTSPTAEGTGQTALDHRVALPPGIRFRDANYAGTDVDDGISSLDPMAVQAGEWQTLATFLPDGTTQEDVTVVLQSPGTRPIMLQLRALTGSVTVTAWSPNP